MINRKTFVGASVASVLAADAVAASAQSEALGKPHPPFVPENDPSLDYARPQLPTGIGSYAALPKSISATTPGIVISTHFWNVDTQIRDVARRFAKLGYATIVPALLDRTGVPNGDDATETAPFGAAIRKAIEDNRMTADLLAGHDWLRSRSVRAPIGIVGFCGGGGFALQALVGNDRYAAASIFYGYVRTDRRATQPAPPETLAWAERVTAPVLGSYGATDDGIAAADIEKAYALMKGQHEYKIYPGAPHAFFDDRRSSYNAPASTDAWARTLAWFGKYLKS
jgi:carboxymethylenebutenolidase